MSTSVPAVYYRGGTSKAVFFHEHDVPAPGPLRDAFLRRVMGSPDPMQIDGMGGTHVVTSKATIIRPSEREDADIDYTFVQVGISDDEVNYSANCGNISSAVGPFAISEGLVKTNRPGVSMDPKIKCQEVRIFNTGTQKVLGASVPVDPQTGKVVEEGEFEITGVPGKSAPILMDYSHTLGASRNKGLLPTGNVKDQIEVGGKKVEITICDVGNLIIMADASVAGLTCTESASAISGNKAAIAAVKEVRGKGSQLLGMCQDWQKVDEQSPMLPMVMLLAPPKDPKGDIAARLFLDNRCHDSMAGTGSMCLAACTRVPGSIANERLRPGSEKKQILNISHPIGIMPVTVIVDQVKGHDVTFKNLSFVRTARRIMTGVVHVPASLGFNVEHKTKSFDLEQRETPKPAPAAPKKEEAGPVSNVPISHKLAEFATKTTFKDLSKEVVDKLKELLLDNTAVTSRAATIGESTQAFVDAMTAMGGVGTGKSTVLAKGQKFSMETAALLNAAFSHTFDFDDTFAAGASHPGASLISIAYAQGEAMGVNGEQILTALSVGYEISTRLARALNTGAYARGFHNTSTAGIFGSVAVLASLKGLSTELTETAFGLALSKAAGSMQFLDNGSWNKRLHPGFAARDAFLCVALAEAGVRGSAHPIEGTYGLLHAYSGTSTVEGLADDLGSQWVFLTTALKPFPACRMTHAALELAADFAAANASPVESITIHLSPACHPVVGKDLPNKRHPVTTVDAQFSCYFQVANAWMHGAWTGWDAYQNIGEQAIHDLADRITIVADPNIPDLGTQLDVVWKDGSKKSTAQPHPLGEVSRPFTPDKVQAKYNSLAVPVYGKDGAARIEALIAEVDKHPITDLLALVK